MQVFELHFNPKKVKEETAFDSFCFEAENAREKKMGDLYMVGQLSNLLPQNSGFLQELASVIKKEYYLGFQRTPEQSFKESLKKVNEFLANTSKNGNVSWMGNLDFGIFSFKDFILNFSRAGFIKILLLRDGQIIDIGSNLEFQDTKPSYPSKIFSNMAKGKLVLGDRLIILTQDVFEFFTSENIIKDLSWVSSESSLKEFLKSREKALSEISGICLLLIASEDIKEKKQIKGKKIKFQNPLKGLFKINRKLFSFNFFSFLGNPLRPLVRKIALPKISIKKPFFLSKPTLKRNIILVLALIFILSLGYFVFKGEREEELKRAQLILEEAQREKIQAESFLILMDKEKANSSFQEAWILTSSLIEDQTLLRKEALILRNSLEEELLPLNNIEDILEPELLFSFEDEKFFPQKILDFNSNLYLFNPYSLGLYELKKTERASSLFETSSNFKLAVALSDSIVFFSKPNILLFFKDGEWSKEFVLPPYLEFNFSKMVTYNSNLYFFDAKKGEITKRLKSGLTELWLKSGTKKPIDAKSMAIDGNIWTISKENKIERYRGGEYQETLEIILFPYLESPTKIWTSLLHPYLYILEPSRKRIVVLTKQGKIVKQYQSDKFNSLLDFSVSPDNKTIWLLNGQKVYQIKL
ncbi:MAG: hypothetical protein CMI54_05030 [Parcubacteria group bacterium]|nr:hypothetical protein [Parcubacteria group bacterium]|tara:strand:- start:3045 stop:4967 length:1923 start_codon:yes stop_codon:yes gene_type:complete